MHGACLGLQGLPEGARHLSCTGMAPSLLPATLTPFPWVFLEGSAQTEGRLPQAPASPGEGRAPGSQDAQLGLQIASHPPAWPSSIYNNPSWLAVPALQREGLVTAFIPKVSLKGEERRVRQKQDSLCPHPIPTSSSFTAPRQASGRRSLLASWGRLGII